MSFPPLDAVRWGIIGCGNVTEVKSGPALQRAAHSSLVAVMRRDGARARDYAQRHGVHAWYDDAQALVNDPSVNAVYVATPPSTHKAYALMAIAAGKPVYVEKPMAMDAAECQAIIDAGRAAGVPVFVAYYRRALPRFRRVRTLLDAGAIGAPRSVHVSLHQPLRARYADPAASHWHVQPAISGGGLFMDLGCHTLNLLDWLFGPIATAKGLATNQLGAYAAEDSVAMGYAFASGLVGTGLWQFGSFRDEDRIEITGDRGRLAFATFGDGPIVLETAQGSESFHEANPPHIQQPLIETIVAELRGEAGACPSTPAAALRTAWVMDRVLADWRTATGQSIGT
ncbi:MAG: Gfo/Idh/MocA family oxidoreductase [Xanthomonadaceae bacterium]|nr:Gfo/Idh/MocA family oxidoreductase [Xanthomonadaceae bacterium]MDE1962402.1 Gfo/Idh/MocA family oxidoreductase [Xanthomonadaceae bacterium]